MKCPKCDHDQSSEVECEACGIIFEKYLKMLELFDHPIHTISDRAPSLLSKVRTPRWLNIAVSLTLVWAILTYGFRLGTATETSPQPTMAQSAQPSRSGISKQHYEFKKPGNAMESSQLATVFIETPWGAGSGFFIDGSCRVITNKHLLTIEDDEISALHQKVQELEHLIAGTNQPTEETAPLEDDPTMAMERFGHKNGQKQNSNALTVHYAQLKRRLAAIEKHRYSPTYIVTLFDDTAYTVTDATFSETHDLALLQLNKEGCPCLKPGTSEGLRTGQPVFTIGTPSGLSHTVTSGVISGRRTHEEHTYIQIDAPINPGNSGGPLIDHKGRVVGINTTTPEDAEGIGFAIPIEVALNEFQDRLTAAAEHGTPKIHPRQEGDVR